MKLHYFENYVILHRPIYIPIINVLDYVSLQIKLTDYNKDNFWC